MYSTMLSLASAPIWLNLTRVGSTITAAYSTNGATYTPAGTPPLPFTGPLMIGMAVSSRNNSVLASATFDNVLTSASVAIADVPPVNAPPTVSLTQPAGGTNV